MKALVALFSVLPLAACATENSDPGLSRDVDLSERELPPALAQQHEVLPGDCGKPSAPVGLVQGRGFESSWQGSEVTVEGIVVADLQVDSRLGGFFVQSRQADQDPLTSDGLFVFEGHQPTVDVEQGHWVRVTGQVREREALTELVAKYVVVCGSEQLPSPEVWRLPLDDTLERVEGTLVRFPKPLVATDTYAWQTSGEITLAAPERLFNRAAHEADTTDERAQGSVVLGSGRASDNGARSTDAAPPRLGATVDSLTGVISERDGVYVIDSTEPLTFVDANPRPIAPPPVAGSLRVASFNLENYFVTLLGRGAGSTSERARQRDKLVSAIVSLGADVLALVELENRGSVALDDLVVAVNEKLGVPLYARAPEPAAAGTDAIRVGLIYKPAAVELVPGTSLVDMDPAHRRPPLAQGFVRAGERFSIIVTHAKSRNCRGARGAERDSGSGCFSEERVRQSRALLRFVSRLKTETQIDETLVLGDFNAHPDEPSLQVLTQAGLVGELDRYVAPADRYSYVFDGKAGLIDHAFATPGFSARVRGAAIWHINADEPLAFGYRETNPPEFFEPGPFRSSDHDPIVVGLAWGK